MIIYNNLMPVEVIKEISSYLGPKDCLIAEQTCKAWNALLTSEDTQINGIWKNFLNKIFIGCLPDDHTYRSFFIKKTIPFIEATDLRHGYCEAGYAHIMLSRLGLSNINRAVECANQLKTNTIQKSILNYNLAIEFMNHNNIESATKICKAMPKNSKRYELAIEIIKYCNKMNQLDSTLSALKFIHNPLYLNKALRLLTWNFAHANKPKLALKAINYVIIHNTYAKNVLKKQRTIEDLKNIKNKNTIGVCARYLYNFFIKNDESAFLKNRYRSHHDVTFYLENNRFSEAEQIALSCKKAQGKFMGLQKIFLTHRDRGNVTEAERLADLIFSILKNSNT